MRLFLLLILSFCFSAIQAQNSTFESSLSTANTALLSSYFDGKLELSTPSAKGVYSKQQAKVILDQFFQKNIPNKYTYKHDGGSKERSLYEIGKLECQKDTFRTYILYNLVEGKPQIIELRIEKE